MRTPVVPGIASGKTPRMMLCQKDRNETGSKMMRISFGIGDLLSIFGDPYSRWVATTYPFARIGHNFTIHHTADLARDSAYRIKLGNSVRIDKGAWVYAVGSRSGNHGPALVVEDNCLIARYCQIAARNLIHLEPDVILSASVLITDHIHAYEDPAVPIRKQGITEGGMVWIESGCWIGHGAAIVCEKGQLVLGRNCIVGANTVVTRSFPAFSVIAGNPARVVRHYDPERGAWVVGSQGPAVEEKKLSFR